MNDETGLRLARGQGMLSSWFSQFRWSMAALAAAVFCSFFSTTVTPGIAADPNPLKIAWFSELGPEHSFWKQNHAFASAAAQDLGVELIPHYVHSDQILYRELLADCVAPASDRRVDGVIFLNIKRQGHALLRTIEQGDVPAISNVLSMDYSEVGMPRGRYQNWIGEIIDNEAYNGHRLAMRLIKQARARKLQAPDGRIHLVAVNGKATDSAAERRHRGLLKAVAEQDDVTLHQTFYAVNWSRDEGELFARVALQRYPRTCVVWCANDDVLLGVLKASETLGRSTGRDLLVGSIDGTIDVIRKVASGEVECTLGGLSLHGGWAVVLMHDYLHGIDFRDDTGLLIRNETMMIDRKVASEYLDRLGDGDWSRVDFQRFSKVYRPDLESYPFSLAEVMLDE